MLVFYFFAAIVILLGVTSLVSGFRFSKYVRRELTSATPQFTPFVSVIAPCRGVEEGLRENLGAILAQNYPAYEVLFVSGLADDPGLIIARDVSQPMHAGSVVTARIVVAGEATDSGQKVH